MVKYIKASSSSFLANELERILEYCPEFRNAKYVGNSAYINLSDGMKIRAYLVTVGTYEHYEAVKIAVFNNNRDVDSITLKFKDYFEPQEKAYGDKIVPYIWYYRKFEWYAEPTYKDLANLGEAISDYVDMYLSDSFIQKAVYYGMNKSDYDYLNAKAEDVTVDEVDGELVYIFEFPIGSDVVKKYSLDTYSELPDDGMGWYYDPKSVEFQKAN